MKVHEAVAICGKSGSGKTTLSRALVKGLPETFYEVVSCTTRPKRSHEVDGVDYHFLSVAAFRTAEAAGDFIETAEHDGHQYGSWIDPKQSKVPVLVLNASGIDEIRDKVGMLHVFEVWVDERQLRKRLIVRGDSVDEVEKRLGWEAQSHRIPKDALRIMNYSTGYAVEQVLGAMRLDQTTTTGDPGVRVTWTEGVGQGRGAAE